MQPTRKNLAFRFHFVLYFILALATLLAGLGKPALAADPDNTTASPLYTIGLGDSLEVHVWREPDISRPVSVRLDGRISLPLIGDVHAEGKTLPGLTKELEKLFSKVIAEPAVSIMLLESKSRRYYTIGKIQTPGEFSLETPTTILQAIARSGGFLEWAKTDEISIIRQGSYGGEILTFDYDGVIKGKNLEQNVYIFPGDIIVIP